MDEKKSPQFQFLLLINKCILLFEYVDIYYQQEILNNIKIFIKNLEELFSKKKFNNKIEKKNKILEVLITYFEKLIYEEIVQIVKNDNKDSLYRDIESRALLICTKKEKIIDKQRIIEEEYKKKFGLNNIDQSSRENEHTITTSLVDNQFRNENLKQIQRLPGGLEIGSCERPHNVLEEVDYMKEKIVPNVMPYEYDPCESPSEIFYKNQISDEEYLRELPNHNSNLKKTSSYDSHYEQVRIKESTIPAKELMIPGMNISYSQDSVKKIIKSDLIELEKKINNKIKNVFSDIENNIKLSLKDYISYTENVEYDLDKKFNIKIENVIKNNNLQLENKIKDIIKNVKNNNDDNLYENINNVIKFHITGVYKYINENVININDKKENDNNLDTTIFYKKLLELENNTNLKIESSNDDVENKIKLLGNIINNNIKTIFSNLNNTIIQNEDNLLKLIEDKINIQTFNKNNFDLEFDKEQNEIRFFYCNELITSTRLNIKGLIGPKGPPGSLGEKGDTPIFRKISFDENNKLKFIIQDSTNIYEIISEEPIPEGPRGERGERGDPGRSIMDLKWEQDNVMRIDEENKDSLIFLKSLCIGEKSHCLKNNSIAIGGGICYQNNSMAIGQNSKTLDSESIAFFGSSIGKKSFVYRADNVDENIFQIGKKEKSGYNINSVNINSKEINLECDTFNLKANKYENNKFKELEERIISIEKKLIDIFRKL